MSRQPWLLLALAVAAILPQATAQSALPAPHVDATDHSALSAPVPTRYDAISIHEHAADEQTSMWRVTPDGFKNTNIGINNMAAGAYDIKLDLVSGGPGWVYSKGFDTTAKLLPGDDGKIPKLTEEQRNQLMRNLLADRFHLQAHVETRILPTYDLVVAKGGVRMKAAPPLPPPDPTNPPKPGTPEKPGRRSMYMGPGHLVATDLSSQGLADELGYMVNKTVIDKTGLAGNYDLTLDYTPDEELAHPNTSNGADPKPDIFTGLQEQLGLKLVPSKGPVRTLVIDHAELPTAN